MGAGALGQRAEPGRVTVSAGEWQWRDGCSGPGYMQRVVSSGMNVKIEQAYNRWIDHAMNCPHCWSDEIGCETAQGIWKAYREARGH